MFVFTSKSYVPRSPLPDKYNNPIHMLQPMRRYETVHLKYAYNSRVHGGRSMHMVMYWELGDPKQK